MSSSDTDKQHTAELHPDKSDTQTLEYLISVVVENRDQRCAEIRDNANSNTSHLMHQAHGRVRDRVHRHVMALREKQLERVSAAQARNQTMIRQQRQLADKELLEIAWPILQQALMALWKNPASRRRWLAAAITAASSIFFKHNWRIEHPVDFDAEEKKYLQQHFIKHNGTDLDNAITEMSVSENIEAGIRIIADGAVFDATLEGLLQQKTVIEAMLLARIKQEETDND